MDFLPILIAVIVVVAFVAVLMIFSGSKGKNSSKGGKQKSRQVIIKEATKKLTQNPHNPDGLIPLANLYYQEQLWDKAFPLYETMLNIAVGSM